MNKSIVYVSVVIALMVGLALGYGLTATLGRSEPGEVRNASLRVGDPAPDFRLPDHTGGYVRLSSFRGQSNVILAFYPLAWTPV